MNMPDLNQDFHKLRFVSLNKTNPEFCEYINTHFAGKTWMEKLYDYKNGIVEKPECACGCGNKVNFGDFYSGYHKYYGKHSLLHGFNKDKYDPDRILEPHEVLSIDGNWLSERKTKTNLPRFYIFINYLFTEFTNDWKEKLYLYAHNLKEPHKCPVCGKFTAFLSYDYGYETFCGNVCSGTYTANKPQTHEKFRNTCKKLYSVEHPMQFEAFKDKVKETIHMNLKKQHQENGTAVSKFEIDCKKIVTELGKIFVPNDRIILYGRELDMVLIEHKIAIECNGSYYHSIECTMNHIEKDTHMKKWRECFGSGLELVSIWEDWDLEDIHKFLAAKFEGNCDVIKEYKQKWFPELLDNEWPLDLGFPQNFSISDFKKEYIREHRCMHSNKVCYDSGILKIF